MRRLAAAASITTVLLAVGAPSAMAQSVVQVADAIDQDGYYVEPGSEPVSRSVLEELAEESEIRIGTAVLADEPFGGAERLAEDVLAELGEGTVFVASPEDFGVRSDEVSDADIEAAFDAADQQSNTGDLEAYLQAFSEELDDQAGGGNGGGFGGFGLFLVVGGLAILGIITLVSRARTRKAFKDQRERSLKEARDEVGAHVAAMAERIVALTDRVGVAANDEATRLFAEATSTYTTAQDHLERSASLAELEHVTDELDHARWQLEAVTALIEGRTPPPEPEEDRACFFDPTHGAATADALIEMAAGQRTVKVCSYCKGKLDAGEAPEPRMIDVGGQQVPAAMAPRSYGGGGRAWVEDFTIVMGPGRHRYGWGGYSGYGGWGSGWGGWGGGGYGGGYSGGYGGGFGGGARSRVGGGGRSRVGGGGRSRVGGGGRSRSGGGGHRR